MGRSEPSQKHLPSGTVTFLFTDIEGSTRLWEADAATMQTVLARHDALMRAAVASSGGYVFKTVGDAFWAAFETAPPALEAALAAQIALREEPWPAATPIRVRMALHTGAAQERDGDYFGRVLNRAARLLATGHGGQTLLSAATWELVRDALPADVALRDMGAHRFKDLERPERVYQLDHPRLPDQFPAIRSLDSAPNNLPVQPTSFIGREKEIAELTEWLSRTPLLTLTGSGGCGKTRLALQVAAEVLDAYPDGVYLVELAPLTDPVLIAQSVASALGVPERPGVPLAQSLFAFLSEKHLLLLLDNGEHLRDGCARLVSDILRGCPRVRILVTSRERLGIAGEQVVRVPSLSLPDPTAALPPTPEYLSQFEAVQLFVARALAVLPGFAVTNASAPALASLCHRLDGIPLAIELAAARTRSLTVEDIHARLDSRFRLLTGGDRSSLPRQQTLRALIDWSHDLLDENEKTLLARLAVFVGGWTMPAAEAVCGFDPVEEWEVLDLMTSLVDKSLVQVALAEGSHRYGTLETVGQYAGEKLAARGESPRLRERHRDYFLALVEEARPHLSTADQMVWVERLDTEHDNLRAVLDGCASRPEDRECGLRLVSSLGRFWSMRGYLSEGRERVRVALANRGDLRSEPVAVALLFAGSLAKQQGDYAAAWERLEESAALFRALEHKSGLVSALIEQGDIAGTAGYPSARALCEEGLALAREVDDRRLVARCLCNLAWVVFMQGDRSGASALYDESLAFFREVGDRQGVSALLTNRAIVASTGGDLASARSLHEESLRLKRELGDRQGVAIAHGNLANVASDQGDYDSARAHNEESLAIFRVLGDRSGVARILGNLGNVAMYQGDAASARSLCEESLTLYRAIGDRFGVARLLLNLGTVIQNQEDHATAGTVLRESLRQFLDVGDQMGIAFCLENLASTALRQSRSETAVALWGASDALRESIGAPLAPGSRTRHDQDLEQARTALGEAAYALAWDAGRQMPLEQAVEAALTEPGASPTIREQ